MTTEDTSLDLSTLSHSSPAPSVITASLSTLPPDLKIKIAEELLNLPLAPYEREAAFLAGQKRGREAVATGDVASLARASKQFLSICTPVLWKDVKLSFSSFASFAIFVGEALPRYSKHIRTLTLKDTTSLRVSANDDGNGDTRGTEDGPAAEIREFASRLAEQQGRVAIAMDEDSIVDALTSATVIACVGLQHITISASPLGGDELPLTMAVLLGSASSSRLTSLHLSIKHQQPDLSDAYCALIRLLPNLSKLEITFPEPFPSVVYDRDFVHLAEAASAARMLDTLSLNNASFLSLGEFNLSSPVKDLFLTLPRSEPSRNLLPLLSSISSTLETFTEAVFEDGENQFTTTPPLHSLALPRLHRLSVSDLNASLVKSHAFNLPALQRLDLDSWDGNLRNLIEFVESSSSLKSIDSTKSTIGDGRGLSDGTEVAAEIEEELQRLGQLCKAKGVVVQLPPVVDAW